MASRAPGSAAGAGPAVLRLLLLALWVRPLAAGSSSSCAGHCGSWAEDCWCNDACEAHGNCCSDYAVQCGGEKPAECQICGRYSCDDWIAWDANKYSCDYLKKEWGCTCQGCKCHAEAGATLNLLTQAKYPEARCLDGSMAGYYIRKGEKDKYLLHFEGGGWCYDQNCNSPTPDGTLKDCWNRAGGNLGSSKRWARSKGADQLSGMLSSDAKENPVFHDWTLVYVPYCDGASFTGDSEVEGLHFKGHQILQAVLNELETEEGLLGASRVVLSGGSAGASAVYYHADYIAKRLQGGCAPPQATERLLDDGGRWSGARDSDETCRQMEVVALPDAGFFLDLPDHSGTRCWPNQMISLFNVSRGYSSLHAGCLDKFKTQPWRCLFPQYYTDLIQTRMFVLNSLYDSSEISYTLGLDCSPEGESGWKRSCTPAEMKLYEALRTEHLQAWKDLVRRPGNGVWAPACIDHTMSWSRWTDSTWEVPAASGNTMAAAVQRWLAWPEGNEPPSLLFEDQVSWPDNRPCSGQRARVLSTTTAFSFHAQDGSLPWLSVAAGCAVAAAVAGLARKRRPRAAAPSESTCEMSATF